MIIHKPLVVEELFESIYFFQKILFLYMHKKIFTHNQIRNDAIKVSKDEYYIMLNIERLLPYSYLYEALFYMKQPQLQCFWLNARPNQRQFCSLMLNIFCNTWPNLNLRFQQYMLVPLVFFHRVLGSIVQGFVNIIGHFQNSQIFFSKQI